MNNKSMLLALGASLTLAGVAQAKQFQVENLATGYGNMEGSFKLACGNTKCNAACTGDSQCEGKCNTDKKDNAKCNTDAKEKSDTDMEKKSEAKCGAGKCGGTKS